MAEYLLKGGKMLEKTCRQCGCPQFEYKGRTFCVVCAEREQEKKGISPPQARGETGSPTSQGKKDASGEALDAEVAATVLDLCRRIRNEDDPDRCLVLMDAVKIGTETIQILRQL